MSDGGELSPSSDAFTGQPTWLDQPAWKQVLILAWPALVQNWLTAAVHLSDRWLAGKFQEPGSDPAVAQSAQTTAIYLAWFLSSYASLVSVGGTALVARMVGAGDRRGARAVLHQALLLALVLGLVGTVVGLVVLEPALTLLELGFASALRAAEYFRPMLFLLPVQMVGAAGIACLIGAGDTRTGLWVLGGVTLLNLPLAWLCFHGVGPLPPLGFVGIAVGTALSQAIGAVVVLIVLVRGRAGLRLSPGRLWPRYDLLDRILRVSVPAAVDSLSMQVGYLWFLGIVNRLGDTAGAAHGIALGWEALGYQSGAAFGTAAVALIGQHLGAGHPDRAARSGWIAFALGAGLMSFMGAVFYTLAVPMFQVFCPRAEQAVIVEAGVPALRLMAFGMPALGSCMVLGWGLRGAGDTRVPMLCTWLGFFCIRIPLAYWLTRPAPEGWGLGLVGAWWAMFADVQIRGACVLWRFASGRWKRIRV